MNVRRVAAGFALAWATALLLIGVLYLAMVVALSRDSGSDTSFCDDPTNLDATRCSTFVLFVGLAALEIVVVNAFGAAASIGMLRGRRWARPAVVTAYAILGPLSFWWPAIGYVVGGSMSDRPDATTVLATLPAALLPPVVCLAIYGVGRRRSKGSFFLGPDV